MSTFVIALLLSAGIGAWLYSKFTHTSGGSNTKSALVGTAVTTVILFIVLYLTLSFFLKK